jgi:hypothetical protein
MEKRKRTRITSEALKKVRSLQDNSGGESEVVVRSFHSLLLRHALGGRQQQQQIESHPIFPFSLAPPLLLGYIYFHYS